MSELPAKQNNIRWMAVCWRLLELLFPSLIIWQIQRRLNKASWVGDPWFEAQAKASRRAMLALLLPSVLAITAVGMSLDFSIPSLTDRVEKTAALLKKGQFKKAREGTTFSLDPAPLKRAAEKIAFGLSPVILLSLYILSQNKILKKQRLLMRVLKEHRFWGDQKPGLAVYTPIGILLDVKGHAPKDLVFNKSIWVALNMMIDERDWLDQPEQRSIVFFKHAFELKSAYIYKLDL